MGRYKVLQIFIINHKEDPVCIEEYIGGMLIDGCKEGFVQAWGAEKHPCSGQVERASLGRPRGFTLRIGHLVLSKGLHSLGGGNWSSWILCLHQPPKKCPIIAVKP